ncbi:transposase [Methylobacterium sp. J-092]|nr:transposase [Methylobacterium sp. J-092]MCJ2006811.1 transposase [Methylobacterium sp. J-092]
MPPHLGTAQLKALLGRARSKRFANEQIAFALRQAKNSTSVHEVCRKMDVFETTFYRWMKQFVGMGVPSIC